MDNHSQRLHSGQLQAIVADVVTHRRHLLFLLALVMAQITQLCYQIFAPTTRIPHHTSIRSCCCLQVVVLLSLSMTLVVVGW